MLTAQTGHLLKQLKAGVSDAADIQALSSTPAQELIAELAGKYPVCFQERRVRDKWELGRARALRYELERRSGDTIFPLLYLMPVLRSCLFLSGEGDSVTGISVAGRMVMRPIRKPFVGLAVTTARGFKLDKSPDGWGIKPLEKRTVRLTEEFLRQRGWQFEALRSLQVTSI